MYAGICNPAVNCVQAYCVKTRRIGYTTKLTSTFCRGCNCRTAFLFVFSAIYEHSESASDLSLICP